MPCGTSSVVSTTPGDDVLDQPLPPVRGDRPEPGHGGQHASHVAALVRTPDTVACRAGGRITRAGRARLSAASILSTIITPPNAAATAADTSRSPVPSFPSRPTSQPARPSSSVLQLSPASSAVLSWAPSSRVDVEDGQRQERCGDHLPAGGQLVPQLPPARPAAGVDPLGHDPGVALGSPVDDQGDQDRDGRRRGGRGVRGGHHRRGDDHPVDAGRGALLRAAAEAEPAEVARPDHRSVPAGLVDGPAAVGRRAGGFRVHGRDLPAVADVRSAGAPAREG